MKDLALYFGIYLCLLVALIWLWHRLIQGSGREPNGVSTAERAHLYAHPHGDAWPFDSATPESSRPDYTYTPDEETGLYGYPDGNGERW